MRWLSPTCLALWLTGQRAYLAIRGPGFASRLYATLVAAVQIGTGGVVRQFLGVVDLSGR